MMLPVSDFTRRMVAFVRGQGLLDEGARVLVAVSGGPDSCALLLSLLEAAEAGLLPRPVGVAHFHHGVRGADADEEASFVAGLCARFQLPCVIGLGQLPKPGGHYQSETARRYRYEFLTQAARDLDADTLTTAHTESDQAETVLWRLFRGTGLDGLGGISPRRRLPASSSPDAARWLVRPLLYMSREDVEAYCHTQGIHPRHDPSNDEEYYLRVRMRRLLPDLARQFNPRLTRALVRIADTARTDDDLLQSLADEVWASCTEVSGISVTVEADLLCKIHPALRRRVLLRAIRRAFTLADAEGQEAAASTATVARLEAMLSPDVPDGAVSLPGKLRAARSGNRVSLQVTIPLSTAASDETASLLLPIPGAVYFAAAQLTIGAENVRNTATAPPLIRERRSSLIDVALPLEAPAALRVRAARAGDRLAPLGMGGRTRLVRDILAEAKVPVEARPYCPVVTRSDTSEILWLAGLVQAETTRVTRESERRVRLFLVNDVVEQAVPKAC